MNWTPDQLTDLATAYWKSATLLAAVELGLFDALESPQTPEALSELLGTRADLLTPLLESLTGLQILEKVNHAYAIAPTAGPLLSRGSPTCMLDALRYNCDLFKQWQQLANVVRTGEPAIRSGDQLGADAALTRRFVRGMEAKARAFSPALVNCIDVSETRTLLDVGSGPGTLPRLLAEQFTRLKVTLLDLPEVIALARPMCESSPAFDRLSFVPADYRRDVLPKGFDAVLYAGALHQESIESARNLVHQFRSALNPGGKLFIIDLMLDDNRTSPLLSSLFQLSMKLSSPTAHVFSAGELAELLRSAGFELRSVPQPTSGPYRIVSAVRS